MALFQPNLRGLQTPIVSVPVHLNGNNNVSTFMACIFNYTLR